MTPRKVRSFVRREGRMTPGQQRAFDELWSAYSIDRSSDVLNFENLFNRKAPVVLEIGFGMGGSLLEMAKADPDTNFLGIEVHRPGVGSLLRGIKENGVKNLRVMCDDAVEILTEQVEDEAFSRVQIFFPDPWPKKRHHKRRLIQPIFLDLLHAKLVSDGILHIATDWKPYAEWMMELLADREDFENCAGVGQYSERPTYRPVTKFERRGEKLGHGVWDLIFKKR